VGAERVELPTFAL